MASNALEGSMKIAPIFSTTVPHVVISIVYCDFPESS